MDQDQRPRGAIRIWALLGRVPGSAGATGIAPTKAAAQRYADKPSAENAEAFHNALADHLDATIVHLERLFKEASVRDAELDVMRRDVAGLRRLLGL